MFLPFRIHLNSNLKLNLNKTWFYITKLDFREYNIISIFYIGEKMINKKNIIPLIDKFVFSSARICRDDYVER
jgi:hypothetical protein